MPPVIDPEKCNGCGACEDLCMGDVIYSTRKGKKRLPFIKYPSECWHCGSCRQDCPNNAIRIEFPPAMLII
jgi:NAD-dependent dihydropyrimidine dehydrogenase PreA subunit